MGHRAELSRYSGPAEGGGRRNCGPDRRGPNGIRATAGCGRARAATGRTGLSGRRAKGLAAGGPALRRPVATQLGPRRFTDLAELLQIVAGLGGAGVGLNPLHAQFYDRPECSGSPYSPNSRQFLNPLYIDVEAIEEFQPDRVASLARDIEQLRVAELVDYAAVATLKLGALRAAFELCFERQRGSPCRLRSLSEGAWPSARMLCGVRDASRTISRFMAGLARALAKADG